LYCSGVLSGQFWVANRPIYPAVIFILIQTSEAFMQKILLKINDLKKYYKGNKQTIKALDGITFNIFEGEIIGLLGVNGAGKTTLSSILATLHPATSGEVLFNDKSIYDNLNSYRKIIGFCPQKVNLDKDLTVEQNLIFAGRYMGVPDDEIKEQIEKFFTAFKLEKYRHECSDILSGGYARRVLIARALMHNPKLLILDEPTVGLDPHIRHQLWEAISALKNMGVTVILTTHYLDEAEFLSDRICVLDKGKIKLIDTPQDLRENYQQSSLEDIFMQLVHEE
jgi:ABC-2 type transport system ATP-binding protein